MYSRIINIVALNEMQLNMFIENFKNTGAKIVLKIGAIQITVTKISANKAIMITVYPNKSISDKAKDAVKNNIKQVKEFIKLQINKGDFVFNQNSLSHE